MANFTYKKATTTTLKACGIVDIEKGTIEIDGEDITKEVIDAIPSGIETVDFKLTFELPDEDAE